MNYQNSRVIQTKEPVVLPMTTNRDIIVNLLPKHFNDKRLPPIGKQPIFALDHIAFVKSVGYEGPEALDKVNAWCDSTVCYDNLPFNDFFIISPNKNVMRVVKGPDKVELYNYIYSSYIDAITPAGAYVVDKENKILINQKWLTSGKVTDAVKRVANMEFEGAAIELKTLIYTLNNCEVEYKESSLSLKSKPSLRRTQWTGTVGETIVKVHTKKTVYAPKEKDPDHVPAPRVEHERIAHTRRYKSGKVIRVAASTINKGSPKGRKTTTYEVEV